MWAPAVALVLVCAAVASASPTAAVTKADPSQLRVERSVRLGDRTILRYRQFVASYEVSGAGAVVARAGGSADVIADDTVAGVVRPRAPRVDRTRAVTVAREAAGVTALRGPVTADLVIDPSRARRSLVWRVRIASAAPLADLEVHVDAYRGRVRSVTDHLRRATGQAAVFDTNPVGANGGHAGLRDARDRDSAVLTSLRQTVPLPNLVDGQDCLVGAWVDPRAGKRKRKVCSPSLDWTDVTRRRASFEALMAYFHIDRMQRYIQTLGLGPINARRQRVNAGSFPADNSFYSPWSGSISLGTGGVDDGEDADVIVHEYGHAIQDDLVPGFGSSFDAAAMGEGFGDYLAAVASTELAGEGAERTACIFDWDAVSYVKGPAPCGRRADLTGHIDDLTGGCRASIHCLGQLWSSALLDLRQAIGDDVQGRSVVDRVVLASHFYLGPGARFTDATAALIEADGDLYGGAHATAIAAEMDSRGLS